MYLYLMFPTQGLQNSQIDSYKKSNKFYLSTARFYSFVPRVYSFYAFIQQLLMPFLPSHPIEKVLSSHVMNIIWAPKCSNHRSRTIKNRIIMTSSYVSKPGPFDLTRSSKEYSIFFVTVVLFETTYQRG